MKAKKKAKLTLKKATRLLSDFIGEQIKKIPPKERRQKTEHAYKKLLARLREKKGSSDEPSKTSQHSPDAPVRLVARSSS
jgi:hypothetical protein